MQPNQTQEGNRPKTVKPTTSIKLQMQSHKVSTILANLQTFCFDSKNGRKYQKVYKNSNKWKQEIMLELKYYYHQNTRQTDV